MSFSVVHSLFKYFNNAQCERPCMKIKSGTNSKKNVPSQYRCVLTICAIQDDKISRICNVPSWYYLNGSKMIDDIYRSLP